MAVTPPVKNEILASAPGVVAELGLQLRADIAGDQVGGSGRIAVMRNAGDGIRLFALGAPEGRVELIQSAVSVL